MGNMLIYMFMAFMVALIWALCTLMEKQYLLNFLEPHELVLIRGLYLMLFFLIYIGYKSSFISKMRKLTQRQLFFLSVNAIGNIIALVIFWIILTQKKAFYSVTSAQPLFIIFVVLLSYLFFKEEMNYKQVIGMFLIIVGIFVVQLCKKSTK